MEQQQATSPVEKLMQVTLAGNLVVLDPLTGREQFFRANEAHDRFANADGEEFTADDLVLAVNERLRQAAEKYQQEQQEQQAPQEQPAAIGGQAAFCTACGKPLVVGDSFCRHCGSPIQT